MNDPGIHEGISSAASEARESRRDQERQSKAHQDSTDDEDDRKPWEPSKEDEQSENDGADEEELEKITPTWSWWASTAFPLAAGTFGPMASAFSICALVENWRVEIPPGGTEEHGIDLKDPRWLLAVNAVSLFCALVANMSLLLNMARRLSFRIAQPITILGFWLASVLLIVLIAVASHDLTHLPGQNIALTQAYYYAIFAAGLYQIISYLMCVTVYGAYRGNYSKEFKLTIAQRTLMLQTISFLTYQLLGALIYSKIEGWKFLDAVYWSDFTLLTIGVGGDYVPKTHLGRGLLFPFALGGIIILGLVVSSIRSLVLERGAKKLKARMTEMTRRRVVEQIANSGKRGHHGKKPMFGLGKSMVKDLTLDPEHDKLDELKRRKIEFEAMRAVQGAAGRERKYFALVISITMFAILWLLGAMVFWIAERNQDVTYFAMLYFSYTSLLTIGYGDIQPESNSGKPFFVFWSLLAIPTLTILISNMGDTVVKAVKDITIWLGELTVLPNDEASAMERLRVGLYKATLGKLKNVDKESGEEELETSNHQNILPPGLVSMFGLGGGDHEDEGKKKQDLANADRMGKDMEKAEKLDEDEAHDRGDWQAEDEHHYRRLIVSQIRSVYADSLLATPKEYSYADWAFFLKLLGEDESDSSRHRAAHDKYHKLNGTASEAEDMGDHDPNAPASKVGKNKARPQWSWIGGRSPLMTDKDEAQWILEKLFSRLEESLRDASVGREVNSSSERHGEAHSSDPKQVRRSHSGTKSAEGGVASGSSSEKTLKEEVALRQRPTSSENHTEEG